MTADIGVGRAQPLGFQLKGNYCPVRESKYEDSDAREMLLN